MYAMHPNACPLCLYWDLFLKTLRRLFAHFTRQPFPLRALLGYVQLWSGSLGHRKLNAFHQRSITRPDTHTVWCFSHPCSHLIFPHPSFVYIYSMCVYACVWAVRFGLIRPFAPWTPCKKTHIWLRSDNSPNIDLSLAEPNCEAPIAWSPCLSFGATSMAATSACNYF